MPTSRIKILLLFLILFISISSLVCQTPFVAEIDEIAKEYVAKKRNQGLVVGIVKGDQMAIKGFGKLSKKRREAPDENTLFEIGGITATFTSSLMMTASQAGQFRLGERIQNHLPEDVKAPKFQPFICMEVRLPNHPARSIVSCQPDPLAPDICVTFCDLASHVSGLTNSRKELHEDYTKEKMYEEMHKYELVNTPGTRFKYSDLGVAVLGHIIADINDTTYSGLLEKSILHPLQMESTKVELTAQELMRLAPAHNRKGKSTSYAVLNGMAPATGLKSSGADMVRYLQANLKTEHSVLADAFEQAHQSRVDVHERKLDRATWMGYGWFVSILSEATNTPVVWQSGETKGFRAYVGFIKGSDLGVVILSNSSNAVDEMGFEILEILNAIEMEN